MNTLKLTVKELELDSRGQEIVSNESNLLFEANESFKTKLILEPSFVYKQIDINNVTSPFLLVLSTSRPITARINGFEFIDTRRLVLNMPIKTIELANSAVYEAEAQIEVYGVQ